jgi:DHA1 family multidrug resistance protein-like MFS transporter
MPFLPLYIQELGVTDVGDVALWTGLSLGVTPAITAICAPFWGRLGDRVGNKLLLQRALTSGGLAMICISLTRHVWQLFALRAAVGLFAGFGSLTLAMSAVSAPRGKMAHAIGRVQTAQRMGPALGPVIGGLFAPLFGLRQSFVAAGSLYLLAMVLVSILYKEPARQEVHADSTVGTVGFRTVLAYENIRLMMVAIFSLQIVERSFGPVLSLHLGELGYGANQTAVLAGVLFSVLAFAGSLGNTMCGRLLTQVPARRLIARASLIASAALATFILAERAWALGIAIAILGVGIGTAMTAAFAAAGSAIPTSVQSTGFGVLTTASMLGVALSPVLSGVVGASNIRMVFAAGVIVLAALGVTVYRVMTDRAAPEGPHAAGLTVEPE